MPYLESYDTLRPMPHPLDAFSVPVRTLLRGYANVGAAGLEGYLRLLVRTCRVEFENRAVLEQLPNYILCYWHTFAVPGFVGIMVSQNGRRFTTFCHPVWHLLMWETLGHNIGWQVIMGSTGHGGTEAAERIITSVAAGYSTFVLPDGPAGPARKLKRGVLHIAQKANAPIIPLRIECDRALWLPRWDRFCLVLPSATIRIRCGAPIHVTEDSFDLAETQLRSALNA